MSKPYEELWSRHHDEAAMSRYEQYAIWTVPSVFPKQADDANAPQNIEHDYQSEVGQMFTALTAKLVTSLFPFGKPFFKLDVEDRMDVETSELNKVTTRACNSLFRYANYARMLELVGYLIGTGNGLLYREPGTGKIAAYSPRRYCTRRNWAGEVRDIVLRESVQTQDIPEPYLAELLRNGQAPAQNASCTLWTHVQFSEDSNGSEIYTETVYLLDIPVNTGSGPKELCPYIPAVWKLVQGEHMGRGLVEDLAGSIARYSELCHALTLYECEALRLIHIVNPRSTVDIKEFNGAMTGESVEGDGKEIQAYEGGAYAKLQQIGAELSTLEQRLQRAFMYTGQFRNAERVTQEEVRQVVKAANDTFGGPYNQLGSVLHTSLAHLLVQDTDPELSLVMRSSEVQVNIVTGLAALARSTTVQGWLDAAQEIATALPVIQQLVPDQDPLLIAHMILESNGIDIRKTQKSQEVMNAAQAPTTAESLVQGAQLPTPGVIPNA